MDVGGWGEGCRLWSFSVKNRGTFQNNTHKTLNHKACKINNATWISAKSKKVRDVSKGGGLQKNVVKQLF